MYPTFRDSQTLLIGIDPSIRALGISTCEPTGKVLDVCQIEQPSDGDYHERAARMAMTVALYVERSRRPVHVAMECPTNWFNERGMDSKNSEAVQKLYFTCGLIVGMLSQVVTVHSMHLATPAWKGQTPKEVMVKRARAFASLSGATLATRLPHDAAESLLLVKKVLEDFGDDMMVVKKTPDHWKAHLYRAVPLKVLPCRRLAL